MINTKGIKPTAVLAALYNASKPLGRGYIHYNPLPLAENEAKQLMTTKTPTDDVGFRRTSLYFDYLKGRVMKVDLSNPDEFDERLYDRDNGQGAAQRAIDSLFQDPERKALKLLPET